MDRARHLVIVLVWTCGSLLLAALTPAPASAQSEAYEGWTVVPLVGLAIVRDHGDWRSAGAEIAVEPEYRRSGWRWQAHASARGLGASCSSADLLPGAASNPCFDGGSAVALGGSRSIGGVWIGAGLGTIRQFGEWRSMPHARMSVDASRLRFDVRVDVLPSGGGVYVPLLVGFPISP